ncbi:MAG: hypothetical protein R2795_17195 [Saprospiraceae bacterium]
MKHWLFMVVFIGCNLHIQAQDALAEAVYLSNQGAYEASDSMLAHYIDQHPQRKYDVARAWYFRSYNLMQLGQFEEARSANDKSIDLRAQLRTMDTAENFLRHAQIDLRAGLYDQALNDAQQGMQMLIENPVLYAELNIAAAHALYQTGQSAEAINYLQTAADIIQVELHPKEALFGHTSLRIANLYARMSIYEQALRHYLSAFSSSMDNPSRGKALILSWYVYHRQQLQKDKSQ